jgi:hypothetical protein
MEMIFWSVMLMPAVAGVVMLICERCALRRCMDKRGRRARDSSA